MRKLTLNNFLFLFVLGFPILIASTYNPSKQATTKTVINSKKITSKIPISVIHYYNYNDLSDWNQLRYNLANGVKKTHGTTDFALLYDNYAKVLHCESDNWKNARNPKSSASGLFQCMADTYRHMRNSNIKNNLFKNTNFTKFRELPLKEQAKYFEYYLKLYPEKVVKLHSKLDKQTRQVYAYLMILKPAAVGRNWNEPVFKEGHFDYKPNKGIPHKGGVIKVSDIYTFCINKFNNQ